MSGRDHGPVRLTDLLAVPAVTGHPTLVRPDDVGGRAAWDVLVRDGVLEVLRGDAAVAAGTGVAPHTRAGTLAAAVPAGAVVAGRTAAWVHDGTAVHDARLLDLTYLPGRNPPRSGGASGLVWQAPLLRDDVVALGGVRVTAPARTAVDLALRLDPDEALALVLALVRSCAVDLSLARRLLERRVRAVGRPRARLVLDRAARALGAAGGALP